MDEAPVDEVDDERDRAGLYLFGFAIVAFPVLVIAAFFLSAPTDTADQAARDATLESVELPGEAVEAEPTDSNQAEVVEPESENGGASDPGQDGQAPSSAANQDTPDSASQVDETAPGASPGSSDAGLTPTVVEPGQVSVAQTPGPTESILGPETLNRPGPPAIAAPAVTTAATPPTSRAVATSPTVATTPLPTVTRPSSTVAPTPSIAATPTTISTEVAGRIEVAAPDSTVAEPIDDAPIRIPIAPEPAQFSQRIDIGRIGDTSLAMRFETTESTDYVVIVRSGGSVETEIRGKSIGDQLENVMVSGLRPGTDYTVQALLNGPGEAASSEVAFRTSGGQPEPTVAAVSLANARVVDLQATRFEVNYESNICANGSFVIRDSAGSVVGRNAGQASGCTTRHLAVPGFWTPALRPNTTYVITITVEANGAGLGAGNIDTTSLTITTAG